MTRMALAVKVCINEGREFGKKSASKRIFMQALSVLFGSGWEAFKQVSQA